MTSSLLSILIEIREKIFGYCRKRDLVNVIVCSKFWQAEVTPLLWRDVTIEHWQIVKDEILFGMTNFKYTRSLIFHGRCKLDEIELFMFRNILQNCDPTYLASLHLNRVDEDAFRIACEELPMVKSLELENIDDDLVFQLLPCMKDLENVHLSYGCKLKDSHLKGICSLEKLQVLKLSEISLLTETSFEYIGNVQQLKRLKLDTGLYDNEVPGSASKLNETLTGLQNLISLHVMAPYLADTFFQIASRNFQRLEYLDISGSTKISDRGLAEISKLRQLKQIDLSDCTGITDQGLASLQNLPNLQLLYLHMGGEGPNVVKITDEGIRHVSKMLSLITLNVFGCKNVTDVGLQYISQLPNLQSLDIGDLDSVTCSGFECIQNLRHLRHLYVPYLKLTNECFEVVSKLVYLEELDITYCENLTNDVLCHLSGLKYLKKLTCDEAHGLTYEGVKEAGFPLGLPIEWW